MMMDFRPVLYIIGIFLCFLSLGMIIPMVADLSVHHDDWKVFFTCTLLTAFVGGSLILSTSQKQFHLSIKQAFLMTTLSWVLLSVFAAVPFYLCALELSFADSFFESVSGLTTTGSTVIIGLDQAPPGILLWRAMLQWLGGIGIIVMAMSVLPFLKVGGMQLFQTESSETEKAMPRVAQMAAAIGIVYLVLTFACMVGFRLNGLSGFDSLAFAMTTLSTGGFATTDSSFSGIPTAGAEVVAIIFMILAAFPFVIYLKMFRKNIFCIFQDTQIQAYMALIFVSCLSMTLYLMYTLDFSFAEALRRGSFNVISVVTGTGFVNADYNDWGGFAISLLFFLTVVGGCAGSASCGIKIFRFQILYAVTLSQFKKLLYPHGIFTPVYNGKALPEEVGSSVLSFITLYAFSFAVLAVILSSLGLDFITSMSAAATALSNVGPGFGDIVGPTGTFASLPDTAKWALSAGMILGRLEIFTVLVIFMPQFWRS